MPSMEHHNTPPSSVRSYVLTFLSRVLTPRANPDETPAHWSRPLSLFTVLFPKNIKAVTPLLPALGSQRNDLAWSHYSVSWTQARKSQWKILTGDGRKVRRGKKYGVVGYSSSEERHMRPYPSLLLFVDDQKIHEEESSLSPMCARQIPVNSSWPVVTQTLWFNSVLTTWDKKPWMWKRDL